MTDLIIDVYQGSNRKCLAIGNHRISAGKAYGFLEKVESYRCDTKDILSCIGKSCWISCSEMLPDVDIPVLTWDGHCVSVERRIEYFLYEDEYTGHTERQYGEYWINGFEGDEENPIGLRDGAATHWMPLPSKPPEATQNE